MCLFRLSVEGFRPRGLVPLAFIGLLPWDKLFSPLDLIIQEETLIDKGVRVFEAL